MSELAERSLPLSGYRSNIELRALKSSITVYGSDGPTLQHIMSVLTATSW
ncbi:hypothetical protein ACWEPL_60920 [Nonomuraea sp. NPDC004186]